MNTKINFVLFLFQRFQYCIMKQISHFVHPNDRHRYEEILQQKYRYISANGDSSSTLMDNIDVQCTTCCNGDALMVPTNEQQNKDYYFDESGTGTRIVSISPASQSFKTMATGTHKQFAVNASANNPFDHSGQSRSFYQTRFLFF